MSSICSARRQMAILLLAHSRIKRFEDPESNTYYRYSPRLHRNTSALVCEWSNAVLFATRRIRTQSEDAGFICDWTLQEATRLALTVAKMILPHSSVCRMNREQSRRVLRWNPADPISGKLYRHQRTSSLSRRLLGGHADLFKLYRMDERFEGRGCEDTEFLRRIPWGRL
jgi:hypothetical protein